MGIAERRTRHKESLRNEILEAARALFVEEGYDAVSMRKVAQRIEYSPTTIYLHFKDKGELFQAICEEMFAKLSRKLEEQAKKRAADPNPDPIAALREGLQIYAKFALKNPEHYTVTFMLPRNQVVPFDGSTGQQAFRLLAERRHGLRGSGRVPPTSTSKPRPSRCGPPCTAWSRCSSPSATASRSSRPSAWSTKPSTP